jgi:hypothetical protein
MLIFPDQFPFLGALESAALLGLPEVFIDAYNIESLFSWSALIDIGCVLLHAKFKDGLSIPVLRNRAILYKKFGVQNR